jgi:hypothetical protein
MMTNPSRNSSAWIIPALLTAVCLLLFSCGGKQTPSGSDTVAEPVASPEALFAGEPPLDSPYEAVVVESFQTTDDFKRDYAAELEVCHRTVLDALRKKDRYRVVEDSADAKGFGRVLIVHTRVPDMRIAGGAARFWGGAFAGSSHMTLDLAFEDAKTRTMVRKKVIESHNNAFAAAWSFGANDRSLPSDMGLMMAEYISATVPSATQ